jgi:phospholipid/cholesterol/gamma-HCH transport system ATP-binding protein
MQIEFKDVWYEVDGHPILKGVSFKVEKGGSYVIIGSSGSGKTTMLRLLLGLIRPIRGQIFIDNEDITKLDKHGLNRLRKRMAIVFQHSALFDSLTVADNVGYRLMEEESLPLAEIRQIVL